MIELQARTSERIKRPALPPPFPAVAVQLIQQMQDPDAGACDVARLIELDPGMTASLLRLVNSPFFGMQRQIASVSDAVMVIGMGAVRRMVLSLAVAAPLRKAEMDPAAARALWHHTVSCAALARRLIVDDAAAADAAFTAGLLHEIGRVQLLQLHGAACLQLRIDQPHGDLRALEIERFGQAHDALGADLLESWGLPQAVADAVRQHHATPPISHLSRVQQAVWVANRMVGTAEGAAHAALHCPDTLAPIKEALNDARAEIEALVTLING